MKKYGVHFGYWGDDYDPRHFDVHLKQVKSMGARIFEVLPADEILQLSRNKILEIKKMSEDMEIELIFSFSFVNPSKYDVVSENSVTREKAVDFLKKLIEGAGLAGGKSIRRNMLFHMARGFR